MIKVQNIYYMLAYVYKSIHHTNVERKTYESFEYADNLIAAMLADGIKRIVKFGVDTDYLAIQEYRCSIKGKININETVKCLASSPRRINCSYDEYSCNTYINKIIKSTCDMVIRSSQVDREYKKQIKNMMYIFQNVDIIDVRHINWRKIRFNRNNNLYALIINLCYILIERMLVSEGKGVKLLRQFKNDDFMCDLYERFILAYYKKHYKNLTIDKRKIKWNVKDGDDALLPEMRSDIMIHYKEYTLIIDAKYYKKIYQTSRFNKETIRSMHLYQIYSYVKNFDVLHSGKISGMLLYANTEEIAPDICCNIDGNDFCIKTLDLNTDFINIQNQLNTIIDTWKNSIDFKVNKIT